MEIIKPLHAMAFSMFLDEEQKKKLEGLFVPIDEAISWIAFNNYSYPAFGPAPAYVFLAHVNYADWLQDTNAIHDAVFNFTRDQLFNAIENGFIICVGKQSEPEEYDEEEAQKKSRNFSPFITFVTAEMLAEGGWLENGLCYNIGDLKFDGLFVRNDDLKKLFLPFKKTSQTKVIIANENVKPVADEKPIGNRMGRRPKYDWELILAAVSHKVGQSGELPNTQAALESMIAEFCAETLGEEPAPSLIRQKASRLFDTFRQNGQ